MAKVLLILLIAGGVLFLVLAFVLALTKGALDVSVIDVYFVVLPRYLFFLSAALFLAALALRKTLLSH